ncbi:hypothetical protein CR513_60694, partial [Mucuna pruriens]
MQSTLIYSIIQNFIRNAIYLKKEQVYSRTLKTICRKVKLQLKKYYGKPIMYDNLTYGKIHNIVIKTRVQKSLEHLVHNKKEKNKKQIVHNLKKPYKNFFYKNAQQTQNKYKRPKQKPHKVLKKNKCWLEVTKDTTSKESKASNDEMCLGLELYKCSNRKTINVLIKEHTLVLISIIDRLEDYLLEYELLQQLNNLIKKEENRRSKVKVIDIKEIYNKFKNPNQLTIKYLQDEIKFF